jgi:dienelactone hydrolase
VIDLHVPAGNILIRDPLPVRVTGVGPGQRVTLETCTQPFEARAAATFLADESGVVDTARDAPVHGDYAECDAAGLIWSARLADDRDLREVLDCQDELRPLVTQITAVIDGRTVATAQVERRAYAANVERVRVEHGRLRGALFRPVGIADPPRVVVVGGSTGGCYELPAAVLAAEGFAALALAYFAYEDLPPALADIPLEYFDEAFAYMDAIAGPGPVGVLGQSRGGELALLLGATFPQVRAVVAAVPSSVLMTSQGPDGTVGPVSWTLHGGPVKAPLGVPFDEDWLTAMGAAAAGATGPMPEPLAGTPMTSRALAGAGDLTRSMIPVEQTRGPILLLSGTADQMWPSALLCDLAEKRLADHDFAYPVEQVRYAGAGHTAAITPGFPTTRNWLTHAQFPIPMAVGGEPAATARAQADAWRRIPEFLKKHLG